MGWTSAHVIWIDINAAGCGWFVANTLANDWEFQQRVADGVFRAYGGDLASEGMDLTVLSHELGHVLGLNDIPLDELMGAILEPGVRRLVSNPSRGQK